MDDMSDIELLKHYAYFGGFESQKDFADYLKVSPSSISDWKNSNKVPKKHIDKLKREIGEIQKDGNTYKLIKNENSMEFLQYRNSSLHVSNTITATKLSPHVSAGNGCNIESIDSVEKIGELVMDICTFKVPPTSKLFAMQVDGYSMTPMVFPDSWVVFDDTTHFKGDGLYVINWRNVLMVKLLQVNSDGMLRIVSANKEYESYTVSPDDQSVFRVFGKVLRTII